MFTLSDLKSKKCTESEYYSQFVNVQVKNIVSGNIGSNTIGRSRDENFNDITSTWWDRLEPKIRQTVGFEKMKQHGDVLNLPNCVKIAKEAARQIRNERNS